MTFTFLRWKKACEAQGFDRNSLPHTSFWQPYTAYYALTGTMIMTFVGGYTVFLPGFWDIPNFLFSYLMVAIFPILFVFWKLFKKTLFDAEHAEDVNECLRCSLEKKLA